MAKIINFAKRTGQNKAIVFIVEDSDIYAKSLQTFIQTRIPNIKEIKIFKIGETCLIELYRNPSIIIMDYFLNSKYAAAHNGLEIIKRIKIMKPKTKIIVLSAQEKLEVVIDAIKQFDCDYVQKDMNAFNKVEKLINSIIEN